MKATWRGIKQLISLKGGKPSFPNRLIVGDDTLIDAKSIANAFNTYFSSIGPMLANTIQPLPLSRVAWTIATVYYMVYQPLNFTNSNGYKIQQQDLFVT